MVTELYEILLTYFGSRFNPDLLKGRICRCDHLLTLIFVEHETASRDHKAHRIYLHAE